MVQFHSITKAQLVLALNVTSTNSSQS